MPLRDYHHLIYTVKPEIESFTGRDWNILSYPKGIDRWLTDNDTVMPNAFGCSPEYQSTYSYMTYLRHFGFPSPFLDWSGSPYVAAFFAFRQPSRCNTDVAIYAYLESTSEIGLKGMPYRYLGPRRVSWKPWRYGKSTLKKSTVFEKQYGTNLVQYETLSGKVAAMFKDFF